MSSLPHTVGIIGCGLLGGSVARALRRAGAVKRLLGAEANPARAAELATLAIVDEVVDVETIAARAELIVIAAPLSALPSLGAPLASTRGIVTDVLSTKTSVMAWARAALPDVRFVGGHPLAGGERAGAAASRADLFVDRCVYLVAAAADDEAGALVENVWRAVGAHPEWIDAAVHDARMAWVSHGPHAVAAALCRALEAAELPSAVAGPGLYDTTRVAGGDARLWSEILVDNAAAIAPVLAAVGARLDELVALLAAGDADAVITWLARAQTARAHLIGA